MKTKLIEIEILMPKIAWHIRSNFFPTYNQSTIDGMLETIKDFLQGNKTLESPIKDGCDITVADLIEDLRLEDYLEQVL